LKISDINFSSLNKQEIIDKIFNEFPRKESPTVITVLDAASVMRTEVDTWYKSYLEKSEYIFADGYYVYLAAKLLKLNIKEQVTGYDLTNEILRHSKINNKKIFFIGAEEQTLNSMLASIKSIYGKEIIAGSQNGYFKESDLGSIIENVKKSDADIILIGIGYPKREIFIDAARDKLNHSTILGVGGVFDILGGKTKRAPKIFIKARIEWLYRFILEPQRLWNRVANDYPKFCLKFAKEYFSNALPK